MSDKSHDPNQMTGAAMIVRALIDHGVTDIFGYPGGAVLPIYDEIFQQSEVQHILVRHEQGAGHAAEGYARSTGKPGVALVTSGPGATNMVTPLTDALMDSIPLVCISGQVPTHLIGNDAFQECDTVGITRPCTKHNWLVRDVNDLAKVLHEAFYVATTGRPGPVLVDVPKDVQFATGTYHPPRKSDVHRSYAPRVKGDATQIRKAVALLANAKRPVIYSGGGVINSGPEATRLLRELVEVTGFPITSTLMGLGAYPASGKSWLGMLGMHGTYEANMTMHDCDVMLCVGARFDDRITGRVDAFSPGSKKIHIDIDPSSINKNIRVDVPIIGDCGNILGDILQVFKAEAKKPDVKAWWQQIAQWRARNSLYFRKSNDVILPQHAIQSLFEATRGKDTYITTEVGQHQMWAAQFFGFEEPHRWMTSGRSRHHGLRPAGRGRRAGGPSRQPRHRHRGRCLGADDDAGDVDGGAVRAADQDLHPEQPVHGHGAAVAAAAPRQPAVAFLLGGAAGFRQARGGLWRRRLPGAQACRPRWRHPGDDLGQAPGAVRLPRRGAGKLFPDDSLRQGAQRDAVTGAGQRRSHRKGVRRRQGAGVSAMFDLKELERAHAIVGQAVPATPAYAWPLLSERLGTQVVVKHENHTPIGAFKVRGGLVYLERLKREQPNIPGIISATRGNHGQSLAFAASRHGVPAVIYVPRGNSVEKNRAMQMFGAELVEHGEDFQAAREEAGRRAQFAGLHMVPSFHTDLVLGVATYALELFQDCTGS
ncbi:acetolactate synthase large subunit [Bradyrhizobium sp. LB7.2]